MVLEWDIAKYVYMEKYEVQPLPNKICINELK